MTDSHTTQSSTRPAISNGTGGGGGGVVVGGQKDDKMDVFQQFVRQWKAKSWYNINGRSDAKRASWLSAEMNP